VKVLSTTATGGEVLVVDAYIDLPQNATVTIKVDVRNLSSTSTLTASVTKCYIIAGYALTSTTPVDILSVTLDPNNDVYRLDVRGNFTYRVGIRWWVKGNRKTTATADITSDLPTNVNGYSNLDAGDDGDSEVVLRIGTGDYSTSFTIKGNVGADGDIIIITSIYCQITLRDSQVVVSESGVMYVVTRHVVVFQNTDMYIRVVGINNIVVWRSSYGGDLVAIPPPLAIGEGYETAVYVSLGGDWHGNSIFLLVNVVVIGE
jgi:hypothetical protein